VFPRLFHIGSFYLPTYGVLVASGVLIGLWISVRNSEKQGINGDDAWNLGILVVLAGIIGAKILYIVNDWSYYSKTGARFSALTPCRQEVCSPVGSSARY
jgi:phosphatidylglycerol:prolipoprotein diacylglycerol transferase